MDSTYMTTLTAKLKQHTYNSTKEKRCKEFLTTTRPKYLFGKNAYAEKVLEQVTVEGIIDDFTTESEYMGRPIVRLEHVPHDAFVLILCGGRPLSAEKRLKEAELEYIDYFAFFKYSGLELNEILFSEGFLPDYEDSKIHYEWIREKFADQTSVQQFDQLIDFKSSYELDFLNGFQELQHIQYFEPFLNLAPKGEIFADVGSFDGFTSEQFITNCPDYAAVHIFEPVPTNMVTVKQRLSSHSNIHYHDIGLSDQQGKVSFAADGSCSTSSETGELDIKIDRLDDLDLGAFSLIKMDIEGAELEALDGAQKTIQQNKPRLAISVYHRPSDIWAIPRKILSIHPDYNIYLRHYTESIYETVMFFVPKTSKSDDSPQEA